MTLDEKITKAEARVRDALARRDTRAQHVALADLMSLRHKRMRRAKRAWLYSVAGEAAQLIAIFAFGYAAYCIASPLPVFA